MKHILILLPIALFFLSCSKEVKTPPIEVEKLSNKLPHTYLIRSSFDELPNFDKENYDEVLYQFKNNCRTSKAKKNIWRTL